MANLVFKHFPLICILHTIKGICVQKKTMNKILICKPFVFIICALFIQNVFIKFPLKRGTKDRKEDIKCVCFLSFKPKHLMLQQLNCVMWRKFPPNSWNIIAKIDEEKIFSSSLHDTVESWMLYFNWKTMGKQYNEAN